MPIPLPTSFDIEPKKIVPYGAVANGSSEHCKPPKIDDADSHYFVDAKGNLQRQSGGIHWFIAGLFIVADVKS